MRACSKGLSWLWSPKADKQACVLCYGKVTASNTRMLAKVAVVEAEFYAAFEFVEN